MILKQSKSIIFPRVEIYELESTMYKHYKSKKCERVTMINNYTDIIVTHAGQNITAEFRWQLPHSLFANLVSKADSIPDI